MDIKVGDDVLVSLWNGLEVNFIGNVVEVFTEEDAIYVEDDDGVEYYISLGYNRLDKFHKI